MKPDKYETTWNDYINDLNRLKWHLAPDDFKRLDSAIDQLRGLVAIAAAKHKEGEK